MESCKKPPYSVISEHSSVKGTPKAIREWLMSLPPDFPVNHFQLQGNKQVQTIPEMCGLPLSSASAWYDHDSYSWKTYQVSLLADTLAAFSEIWPKAGTIVNGVFYQRQKWARRIKEIGCGSRRNWSTPTVMDSVNIQSPKKKNASGGQKPPLCQEVKIYPLIEESKAVEVNYALNLFMSPQAGGKNWPTPRQFMHKDSHKDRGKGNLGEVVGGALNPMWVEWLMGWTIGWTDLKPLGMDKFQLWLQKHGVY